MRHTPTVCRGDSLLFPHRGGRLILFGGQSVSLFYREEADSLYAHPRKCLFFLSRGGRLILFARIVFFADGRMSFLSIARRQTPSLDRRESVSLVYRYGRGSLYLQRCLVYREGRDIRSLCGRENASFLDREGRGSFSLQRGERIASL